MNITTELTIDDHKDFRRSRSGKAMKSVGFLSTNLLLLGGLVLLPGPIFVFGHVLFMAWQHDRLASLLGNQVALAATGLGLLLLPVAFVWMYWAIRDLMRAPALAKTDGIDMDSLRNGLDLGPIAFEALPDSLRVTTSLADEHFHWSAFVELKESDHNLFLMLDHKIGVILPKRAFSDYRGVGEFKSMVQKKIGLVA